MKLLLLKTLLQRRARDEGFTLPFVIAIGLIMILLGSVNIITSSEENLNALSDNSKTEAQAIAEIGVSRYRGLLDRNRILAVNNSNTWTGLTNTCDTNTNTNTIIVDAADTTQWQQVNNGAGNIGQYRLVSYVYDIDNNLTTNNDNQFAPNDDNINDTDSFDFNDTGDTYNPRGILTVKSQATDGSESQVEVEIPIRINEDDMDNLAPALWVEDGGNTWGNLIIDGNRNGVANGTATTNNGDGNIVVSKPAVGATAGCDTPIATAATGNNRIIYDPRALPGIPVDPSTRVPPEPINTVDIDWDLNGGLNAGRYGNFRGENGVLEDMLLLGTIENPVPATPLHQLWRTDAKGFDYFYYKAPSGLTIDNNEKLASDGQSRVILDVGGDINLNGSADLYAGSAWNRNYSSTGLQVYVRGTRSINIAPGGGTVRIKGLIHAPDSTVNITGAGNVIIEGAVWAENWVNSGSVNVTIIPDNARIGSEKAYQHYLATDLREVKPITDAPTDWEIQEADLN